MSTLDRFHQLFNEAYDLEPSPVSVSLAEEAVRLADSQLSIEYQFWARANLIRLCFMSGRPLPMLVAIAWSLATVDRKEYVPDGEDLEILLWQCKHAVTYSSSFANISYKQYSDLFHDVIRRYEAAGASPRSVYMISSSSELFMGHFDTADDCIRKAHKAPRDQYAESAAWELYFDMDHLLTHDKDAEALELMRPMLDNPARAADVDPWFVCSSMFELLRRGERDDAIAHHERALAKIAGNSKFICQIANHISFLSLVGEDARALKLMEQHLEIGLTAPDHSSRLDFCLHCWILLQRLMKQGRETLNVRFPDLKSLAGPDGAQKEMPAEMSGKPAGTFDLNALADWFHSDYTQLAEAFHERNGNRQVDSVIRKAVDRIEWDV